MRGIGARYSLYSVYEVLAEEVIIIELIPKKSNFGVSTFFSLDCLHCVKYASKMDIHIRVSRKKLAINGYFFFSLPCLALYDRLLSYSVR